MVLRLNKYGYQGYDSFGFWKDRGTTNRYEPFRSILFQFKLISIGGS